MSFSARRLLYSSLLAGLAVRIVLAPISSHPYDVGVWFVTGQALVAGKSLYPSLYAYPPLWALFIVPVTLAYLSLSSIVGAHPISATQAQIFLGTTRDFGVPLITDWLFSLLVKIPLICFDLLLGVLLYRIVSKRSKQPTKASFAFAAYFLNPYVIWISSVWGMFDVLPTYFMILGVLLLMDKRNMASGVSFGIAVGLKYYPAIVFLAMILGHQRAQPRASLLKLTLSFLSVIILFSIPFLALNAGAYLRGVTTPVSPGGVRYVHLGYLSIWLLLPTLGVNYIPLWFTLVNLAAILTAVSAIGWRFGRDSPNTSTSLPWFGLVTVSILVFYALFRVINDQYVVWVLPSLILDIVDGRERIRTLIGLSSLALGHILTDNYSFFLPMLTINSGIAQFIPRLELAPFMSDIFGILFWLLVVILLCNRITRLFWSSDLYSILRKSTRDFLLKI